MKKQELILSAPVSVIFYLFSFTIIISPVKK